MSGLGTRLRLRWFAFAPALFCLCGLGYAEEKHRNYFDAPEQSIALEQLARGIDDVEAVINELVVLDK